MKFERLLPHEPERKRRRMDPALSMVQDAPAMDPNSKSNVPPLDDLKMMESDYRASYERAVGALRQPASQPIKQTFWRNTELYHYTEKEVIVHAGRIDISYDGPSNTVTIDNAELDCILYLGRFGNKRFDQMKSLLYSTTDTLALWTFPSLTFTDVHYVYENDPYDK